MRIGVDVGGTHTRAVLAGDDDAILARAARETDPGPDGVIQSIMTVIHDVSASTESQISDIGVGIPGLVDSASGLVHHAANLGIAHLPLAQLLVERTGSRVVVENDVNAATLGALAQSNATGIRPTSFAYVNIGTGLGVGLALNGQIVRGKSGHAGELGHFPLRLTDRVCGCGQRGCIETSTSGAALELNHPALTANAPLPDDFITGLVALLRMITLAVDPSEIVLGGGVVFNRPSLLQQTRFALRDEATSDSFIAHLAIGRRIRILDDRGDVGAVGAALLPQQHAELV